MGLANSRGSLAVVQAHVFAMLDQKNPGEVQQHRMDAGNSNGNFQLLDKDEVDSDGEENLETTGLGDRVWSMDWTLSGQSRETPSATPTKNTDDADPLVSA